MSLSEQDKFDGNDPDKEEDSNHICESCGEDCDCGEAADDCITCSNCADDEDFEDEEDEDDEE